MNSSKSNPGRTAARTAKAHAAVGLAARAGAAAADYANAKAAAARAKADADRYDAALRTARAEFRVTRTAADNWNALRRAACGAYVKAAYRANAKAAARLKAKAAVARAKAKAAVAINDFGAAFRPWSRTLGANQSN